MSSLKLWPKQQEALEFAYSRDATALLCEQRTGKTFTTLALMERLMSESELVGVGIVLLNNKESTWVDKIREHLPTIGVFFNLEDFKRHNGHRLLLVHFEQLSSVIGKLCKYKKLTFCFIDEAHRIYNRGTKQSKAAARLSWVPRRLILTGTPIEKKPTDLWAQFRFLAPWVFGTNWAKFEEEWMDFDKVDLSGVRPGTMAWETKMLKQRILRSRAAFREEKLPQFNRLIKPYCFRMTKEDVGILPPTIKKILVPLKGSQARCYQEMELDRVTELPDGTEVTADMEVTSIMKKRQIASGFVYDDEGVLHQIGGAKQRKVLELFRSLPKPVVIFTAFKPDTDQLEASLAAEGYEVVKVYGKTKKRLRPDIWRSFQRAKYDAIVCQIRTGGVGVDLWKANHAIVHSMGHSFIDWDQAKARLDSRDKNKPATIHVVCAKDTIDEDLFELVLVKHLTGSSVLNQLKQRSHTMATKEATKAPAKKAAPTPPKPPEFKYSMADLEKATNLKPASIRAGLRESTFKKDGQYWGWNNKADFDSVVKFFKDRNAKAPAAANKPKADETKATAAKKKPAK